MKLFLLCAGAFAVAITGSQAQSSTLDTLELFATPLPAHFSVSEAIKGLELRLYLDTSDANAVRVTPTSAGVSFEPSFVLFNSTVSIASDMTAQATTSGDLTVDYVATLEGSSSESFILFSQSVMVLPVPTTFAVDSRGWNGVILQRDSFDNTSGTALMSSFWSEQQHGYASNACGAFDGSSSLFFTSLGDRLALTAPLELEGFHGKMHFYHVYGFEAVQEYDSQGDNRVACEVTDPGEEVRFGYLPAGADPHNVSSWEEIFEIPLSSTAIFPITTFSSHSVILPQLSMHQASQFYWMQKNHSSFPIDVVNGLTRAEVIAAANDPTGEQGQLGTQEMELWKYRNLFDQWAIDNVQLEVRLNVPNFALSPSSSLNNTTGVGIGGINILVASPVPGSWVQITVGDGTQDFPVCKALAEPVALTETTVSLSRSGYVHAVACLSVDDLLISSYPVRSARFVVQALEPTVTTVLDTSGSVDAWIVDLKCTNCDFMRYTVVPLVDENEGSSFVPSCTFGTEVTNLVSGEISVTFNAKIRIVACGVDLFPSELVETKHLVVHPRAPTFQFLTPATTITGLINLVIVPPASATDQELGIVYTIVKSDKDVPSCSSTIFSGEVKLVVKVYEVVRAVACCVGVICADSVIAAWGPVDVQAVKPTSITVCSALKPLTMVVNLAPVTDDASIRYQILTADTEASLTCSSGTLYTKPVEVSTGAIKLVAASCLDGLKMSDFTEIVIMLDNCCSGRMAYTHESCAHVLVLEDDFTQCPGDGGAGNIQTNTNWTPVTSQWGGNNVNGGVHSDNVRCVADAALGKQVLELTANGDLFAGVTPAGKTVTSDGALRDRTNDDRFLDWTLDGISPLPCNPLEHCPARRVGAAVKSVLEKNSGVLVMRIKPCSAFGTLTQVWWGDYKHVDTLNTRFEDEIPFLPLWKSALYQAKTSSDIPFTLTSPQPIDETTYTELVMQWDASAARTNLYIDGQLMLKQMGNASQTDTSSSLSIGVWFPNAAAGEPFFPTCHTYVDEVKVFDLQITGGRWCDYEDVGAHSISCTEDADCEEWVQRNCFMDIFEAVCTNNRLYNTDDSSYMPSLMKAKEMFCQFRLQPTAQTSISSTTMTSRELEMQWEEEEPKHVSMGG